MSEARIESIDALKELRAFLCGFARKMSVAIDEADLDITHTLNWLRNKQYPYWKNELRVRQEQLIRAKLELKNKQLFEKSALGGHNSFIDEKRAVTAAQARFDEAQDKLEKVKRWIPLLETEGFDCKSAIQGLMNMVQIEVPNRRAQIDAMIMSLENYFGISAPQMAGAQELSAEADMARAGQENTQPHSEGEQESEIQNQKQEDENVGGEENK